MRSHPYSALFDCTPSQIPNVYPFPYIAWAPWPNTNLYNSQLDWVESIDLMESWLVTSVGGHLVTWVWTCLDTPAHSACAVAFKHERDRCMFLLRWS